MNSFFRLRSHHPRQHPGWTGHMTVALLALLCIGLSAASRPSRCAYAQAGSENWHPLVLNLSSEGCTIDP
ncbi:hypothetical protein [Acaryochloris thomasi]|uniref:hypothetical protein n=1 Tax=Acaryochloris thomasi TaxID=2929456 RepID=UPI0011B3ADC1|nr:hypothetical protein [Acaryochloris thomasi]